MDLDRILTRAASGWTDGSGPQADIVVSTRVRLARNLASKPFPHRMDGSSLEHLLAEVETAVEHLNEREKWSPFQLLRLEDMHDLDRRVLVEKHLVSLNLIAEPVGRAVVLRDDEMVSVMVNEEDHLRLQCLFPGLQLEEAWVAASGLDDCLEEQLGYAFSESRGYLTCCPTNTGTGLRASVMLHLPALIMAQGAGRVLSAINKLGLVVRGLYGEGTQAAGNLFQISNQVTLGHSEEDVIRNLHGIARQVVDQEARARRALMKEAPLQLEDRIGRAYGILSHARVLSGDEALKLWSDVRLGVDLGLLTDMPRAALNELIVSSCPCFLQRQAGRELASAECDALRAEIIRKTFTKNG